MTSNELLAPYRPPAEWESIRLRWLSKRYAGGTPDTKNPTYWEGGIIPWLNSGTVNQGTITEPSDYITELALKESSAKWIPRGALVMALAGQGKTKAKVGYLDIRTTGNQSLAAIVPDKIDGKFLYWWLSSQYLTLRNLSSQDGRDGLNLEMIGSIVCPVPPPETQRRIARFLDEKTARIDGLIDKKRMLLDRLAEKRQALVTRAVTKGLNPDAPMKPSGIDWLGDIPAHWEVKRLRFLLDGGTLNGLYKPKEAFDPEGIPFVQMGEAFRSPVFDGGTEDCVHASNDEIEKWGLMSGDFLVARRSIVFEGSGKSVLLSGLRGPHLFESSMIRIRLRNSQRYSNFLSFYFQSHIGRASMLSVTKRVTISGIDSQQLKSIHIPVPPHSEARDIAATCETFDRKTQHAEREISASIKRLAEYRDALITAAVTGQLPELR